VLNPVLQCRGGIDFTFLPSGAPERLLILVRSGEVELHPESPLVPVRPTSPFPAPSRQTSPTMLDTGRGMLVFCLLSVEGPLALDLWIATFVVSVFSFAIPGVESILKVQLGVVRALEGYMVVATSWAFPVGFP